MKIRFTGGGLRHVTALATAGASLLALTAVPAHAQTAAATAADDSSSAALEEIIVTAERRSIDIQRTPAAVSTRTGEELAEQGRYTTVQILQDIPGVTAVVNNSQNTGSADVQGNNITIRGITPGTSAGGGPSQISATPATAVYVDGVYEGIGGNYDLERVEVLRGPQGTLYGRSATAGVVAFHTRNPSLDSFGGDATAEVGNYGLQHYGAAVNLPLGDTLAVRVAGDYRDQEDGYFDENTRGLGNTLNGRAKVLWKPSDTFSLLVGFASQRSRSYTGGNSTKADLARTETTTVSGDYLGYKLSREYFAEMNWDLGPAVITYQPAFRTWYQNDFRFQEANFIGSGVPLEQIIQTPLDQFHTQELRIASKDDAAIQWQAGAVYYRNKLRTSNSTFLANPDNSPLQDMSVTADEKDTKDTGFFGEMTFSPLSSVRATLGLRYDITHVVASEYFFDNPYAFCGTFLAPTVVLPDGVTCAGPGQATEAPPPGSSINDVGVTFHNFNYKARVEYDLTPRNMMYAMISSGFRPGDVGIANLPNPEGPGTTYQINILEAEKLTSYELGSKNRFFGDSLQLNAAVYYYDYQGFQTTYRVRATDPTAIPVTVPATNMGVELESLYRITTLDRVGLNYSYVESSWKNKPAAFAAAYPENKRALVPSTITAYYEHAFHLPGGSNLTARIDGVYYSAHATADLHADQIALGRAQYVDVGSQVIGNVSGTWMEKDGRLSITAYSRNFTNQRYTTYTYQGNPASYGVDWNDPRIYGVIVSAHF